MTTATKNPGEDALKEMAATPGMTFARMARELAVDRKTVRRWCRDVGINDCGPANSDAQSVNQSEGDTLEAILAKMRWLIEWNTFFQERLRAIETGLSGFACPLPVKQEQPESDLFVVIMRIAAKLSALEMLEKDEQDLYDDLTIISRAAMREDIGRLEGFMNRHWHIGMSVADSKSYRDEKTKQRNGAQFWRPPATKSGEQE